jgi:EAL domain-containing protein (putative c-di-GMP-specific phosphodiesterase class I)
MQQRRGLNWTQPGLVVQSVEARELDLAASVRGITTGALDIVYQPIVALDSGVVFAQEALVRAKIAGLEQPEQLIAAASKQGALGRLGRVIREAAFARTTSHRLFVNIHPGELSSRWLIRPDDPICEFDGEVFLEITESAAFDYFDLCRSVLSEVRARSNARLVVDDFGAGYSNLKRIVDLEPAIVKLDRELVRGIDRNARQRMLVRQLVAMCTALGAKVVAEGIETAEELATVREAGVQYGQGYLIARPAYPEPTPTWKPRAESDVAL